MPELTARKKKEESEKLSVNVHIKMTQETFEELDRQASSLGLNVSAYIRYLVYREREIQRKGGT